MMQTGEAATSSLFTAGSVRERVWGDLMCSRAAIYPLPPHGHQPNFVGAREAAARLLAHPDVQRHRCLIVGAERALYPLRKQALEAGVALYVPDQNRAGWYFRVSDPGGANLKRSREVGEPKLRPEGATGVVLACVAVDRAGGRLGKGFGWAARGLNLGLPEYTLAHPRMLLERLDCPPDSQVQLIGLPDEVISP
ncbi:5-formyltetrahydrofolate cyclo-ligase [Deinococcus sonorensis]|uniref:5-formyltetrahydrofolate cyclo-ligase n=2 Tax=Deinococcus sonorensis TaxID=309891 RepID=A0AAU7UC70_9DEIO